MHTEAPASTNCTMYSAELQVKQLKVCSFDSCFYVRLHALYSLPAWPLVVISAWFKHHVLKCVFGCIQQSLLHLRVGDEARVCWCASHTSGFSDPQVSPWVCFVKPEPAKTSVICHEVLTWRLLPCCGTWGEAGSRCLPLGWRQLPAPSCCAGRPYSGCSGCVCRPFSGCLMLWIPQKTLCNWSSSDMRGRPMSKCIFRFCSHSSSLEKAGLHMKKDDTV